MSSDLGPGDWVECVQQDWTPPPLLVLGRLYIVERLVVLPDDDAFAGDTVLKPGGVDMGLRPDGRPYLGFPIAYFRPIYRPKSSIIEQLKRPLAEPVRDLIATE